MTPPPAQLAATHVIHLERLSVARPIAEALRPLARRGPIADQHILRHLRRSPELLAHTIRLAGGMSHGQTLLGVVAAARSQLDPFLATVPQFSPLDETFRMRVKLTRRAELSAHLAQALHPDQPDIAFVAAALHLLHAACGNGATEPVEGVTGTLGSWGLAPEACEAISQSNDAFVPASDLAQAVWLARSLAESLTGETVKPGEVARRAAACSRTVDELESMLFDTSDPFEGLDLTPMQLTVMHAINGRSSRQAATHLGVSERTIDKHIENACRRLGVNGRDAAKQRLIDARVLLH